MSKLLAAALFLTLTACTGQSAAPAPPVTSDLPGDIAHMVFPASGPDTRWTQGLDKFAKTVARTAAQACARAAGVPTPESPPALFIRWPELPDLALIRRHGFSPDTAPAAPPAPTPPAAVLAAQAKCAAEGKSAARPLRHSYTALQGQWQHQLAEARKDPGILAAQRGFADCATRHGTPAQDENAFFALVDKHAQTSRTEELRLAASYATCMEPIIAIQDPLLTRHREQFLTQRATEIHTLRANLIPLIRRLESRYGITISFPRA